jgi:GxxExxY protein
LEAAVWYKGIQLDCGFRTDFVVEDELIIELKAVNELLPVHHAQLLTYLRLQRKTVGLLINFNVPVLKDGIRRIVTGTLFQEPGPELED